MVQVSHLKIAKDIWDEAKHLFSGQTLTDFTLTITALVTTKYVDGEDVTTHLAKMKGLRCNLTQMGRDVDMPKGRGCDRKRQAKEDWIRAVALLRL